ncbi:T9SS type A sorting domain-containing protein [Aequorivita sp. H23M31]|uniref:T9SS type A sorting domain-containing protein n=1 Tax=Aequorivita ciconiae TaxID=2494375 RepID=A0A410G4K1_9FLAO|nr:T9SS type A sorting domain-containing protein [Aequorivita sp. H23M31]QAA82169.1 T9SS type A sorting domain-containing protein [Aequorivita sp. H23M31]
MKKLYLFLLVPLTLIGQTQMGSNIFPELQNEQAGWYVSMSADGHTVAVGGQAEDGDNNHFARARVYSFNGQDWIQKGQPLRLLNYSGDYSARCRVSLSGDGNTLVISSPNQGMLFNGNVMIFQYKDSNWELLGNYFIGSGNNLLGYGISLSSNGNIIAMASPGPNVFNEFGFITVRQFDGTLWNEIGQKINGYSNSEGSYSLEQVVLSLSNDGTTLVIGTPFSGENGNYGGEVRVYQYSGGLWVQMGESIFSDEGKNFGSSVSINGDGNTIAIGRISDSEMGYVRVFNYENGQWLQKGVKLYGDEANDHFGASVAISDDGNILAIGAPRSDIASLPQTGQAKIFKFIGNAWSQVGNNIIGLNPNDLFGQDVSLSAHGNILAVASPFFDNSPYNDSGNVNVYDLSDILSTNINEMKSFSLYPNPASDQLNIVLGSGFQLVEVNIYNSVGQLVKREQKELIDISELAAGTYYIQIISPQFTNTKIFIKN